MLTLVQRMSLQKVASPITDCQKFHDAAYVDTFKWVDARGYDDFVRSICAQKQTRSRCDAGSG